MLRSLQKLPIRRLVHTSSARPAANALRTRAGMVVGVTGVVSAYFTWKALQSSNIALDADIPSHSKPLTPKTSTSPEELSHTTATHHEPSVEQNDTPSAAINEPEASSGDDSTPEEGSSEEQGGASGAFNPVTGEINWDCPCLGGMAHGPCGLQFREAFSCFVFSEQEPKGIDCVEKFKAMQLCFREHPEVYADEIMDDDDDDNEPLPTASGELVPEKPVSTSHVETEFVPEEPTLPSTSTETSAA